MKDYFLQKFISFLFPILFFLVPLFFTPLNSELFEFNKIILVYAFSILIAGAWVGRIILQKKLVFKSTFLDIPLVLFLLSEIISTIFSIDPHTSIFGYYSRFNGGLLSVISYLLLYWAFVSNCETKDVSKSIKASLISAVIVSVYGIFEHFGHSLSCLFFGSGFNVSCWVQKVQERVFATLGQPNWLAAYLVVLIPLTWFFVLKSRFIFYILNSIFFMCLLFTQSRSGFLGFLLSFAVFWGILFFKNRHQIKVVLKPFLLFAISCLLLAVVFGTPFAKINNLFKHQPAPTAQTVTPSVQSDDGGISESGDIRKIVWKGAVGIFKHYPFFGSGVETFAYSYYNFRPIEHNLVSEWDFLYNKAHNEYLNYLSTTGIFGLGTYLLFISAFVFWNLIQIKNQNLLIFVLFSGWLSLLVTNFFGFSVVVTSLYFYLIPAFVFVLYSNNESSTPKLKAAFPQKIALLIVLFLVFSFVSKVVNLWRADFFYNQGQKLSKLGQFYESYQKLHQAVQISPGEPVFLSEISVAAANLALVANQQNQASSSAELTQLAINYSDKSLKISPANLNLHKTRIKLFYTLSTIKPEYLNNAIETITRAITLSPTDPKLVYNLGLLYGKSGQGQLAIQTIEKSVEMKPNYVDGRNALSVFYEDIGERQKALQQLEILLKLAPENKDTFEKRIEKLK